MFKDIRPNLGMLWVLLPSTFLKYQNYTLIMYLVNQISLSIAVMLQVNRLNSKYNNNKTQIIQRRNNIISESNNEFKTFIYKKKSKLEVKCQFRENRDFCLFVVRL